MSRLRRSLWLLPLLLWLTACAGQHASSAPPSAGVPHGAPPALADAGGSPLAPDTRCSRDADCTVKNVGNCCGAYPACVNVNSPTDPQGVQAECARSGRMSVCGFREISACQCVQGQCEAAGGGLQVR